MQPSRRAFVRASLGSVGLAGAALALAACDSGSGGPSGSSSPSGSFASGPTPKPPPAVVPNGLPTSATVTPRSIKDVTDFGAVGDGHTDDTDAIGRALSSLRTGQALRFPGGGVFCHSAVLSVTTPGVTLLGPGTLRATAQETSALKIEADRVTVDGLTVTIGQTTQRWSAPDQHKLYLGAHRGTLVRDVTIEGSAAAGVFCDGVSGFRLIGVRVSNTRADGIHMTNGSNNGAVEQPVITASGDDGVAVVSYLSDASVCHDIVVRNPTVHSTTGGRGLSVVGGHDVSYHDIDVHASSAAGVYIACESGDFTTAATKDVTVTGGRVDDANTDAAIDHGAVLIYSGRSGGSVENVLVSDLSVSGTRSTASRQIGVVADGSDDGVSDVVFADLRLAATPTPYQGDGPWSAVHVVDVTADGHAVVMPQ